MALIGGVVRHNQEIQGIERIKVQTIRISPTSQSKQLLQIYNSNNYTRVGVDKGIGQKNVVKNVEYFTNNWGNKKFLYID